MMIHDDAATVTTVSSYIKHRWNVLVVCDLLVSYCTNEIMFFSLRSEREVLWCCGYKSYRALGVSWWPDEPLTDKWLPHPWVCDWTVFRFPTICYHIAGTLKKKEVLSEYNLGSHWVKKCIYPSVAHNGCRQSVCFNYCIKTFLYTI